ncbi:hypothetical protein [Tumebacillus flagellatus]|uniref:Uncharacterized protein n=1 Tax=Tumebacillus flagellatus TaxID=1157490 RepID=A0A074M5D8_9BACL|nr:hypothetical protein [Tumebacillus flagellatus]KEO81197.1 hypothetical protein EL26_21925 [Tumebacillus flagellatus]
MENEEQGLSKTVGLTVGSWEILIALILVGGNALLRRKKPEYLGMLTVCFGGILLNVLMPRMERFLHTKKETPC